MSILSLEGTNPGFQQNSNPITANGKIFSTESLRSLGNLMNITRPVNVTWVMWSKRLPGHKAWDKWALCKYFYYFLCIDYQSVINVMHSQEMPTCPFLTKWLRHRFCIQTWEHRIESCSWWTETFGPSRKLLQCWTTMTKIWQKTQA